jgi:broad specificity phosphatase PhoE
MKDKSLSAIYTSTLKRSILTAQPIADRLGLPITKRAELDEIALGIFEGVQFAEVEGAENYSDVANRVRPFQERILQDHEGQEILIVAHRGVNRMLVGLLLDLSPDESLQIEQTNDCLYWICRNGDPKVTHFLDGQAREGLLRVGQQTIL